MTTLFLCWMLSAVALGILIWEVLDARRTARWWREVRAKAREEDPQWP